MMRWFGIVLVCLAGSQLVFSQSDPLADFGPAPELHDSVWLNTDQALSLESLRGQVVLLHMWTFGCINCIRTLPHVHEWYETYGDDGLMVIGNHYPEFAYEQDLNNLKDALVRLDVPYPVLQDNQRETWSAYNNRYWPTIYLIDKAGHIRYRHIGEGRYDETQAFIEQLLAEDYTPDEMAETAEPLVSLHATVDVLNVRTGPGTDHDAIGSIARDETYAVLDEQNGWYQIRYQGQAGYVSGEYVALS